MKPAREKIVEAAHSGNLALLRLLAQRGADFNEVCPYGDSLLEEIVSGLGGEGKPYKYDVVRLLLELGADPNVLGEERSSPLAPAMVAMDTEMLRILLEAGADPNKCGGVTEDESFFDWAELDYMFEMFDCILPEKPTIDDKKDEDSWLQFLDRIAIKHGVRRPDHLFLLRQHGARSISGQTSIS